MKKTRRRSPRVRRKSIKRKTMRRKYKKRKTRRTKRTRRTRRTRKIMKGGLAFGRPTDVTLTYFVYNQGSENEQHPVLKVWRPEAPLTGTPEEMKQMARASEGMEFTETEYSEFIDYLLAIETEQGPPAGWSGVPEVDFADGSWPPEAHPVGPGENVNLDKDDAFNTLMGRVNQGGTIQYKIQWDDGVRVGED